MAIYTVHLPEDGQASDSPAMERMVLVKQNFSWFAFFLPPLWLLSRRAWLATIVYLVALSAIVSLAWLLGMPPALRLALYFLVHLLMGLEASAIAEWTLRRKGFHYAASAMAKSEDEAAHRFLSDALPATDALR